MTHLERVRAAYAAYGRRDFDAAGEMFAEDIEWSVPGPGGQVRGPEAVRAFFDGLVARFSSHEITIEDAVEQDDRLICFVRHTFTRAGGEPTPVEAVHDWRFRGDQASSLREVSDTLAFAIAAGMIPADALAATADG